MNRFLSLLFVLSLLFAAGCDSGTDDGGYPPIEDVTLVYTASGLPAPNTQDVSIPSGTAGNLTVLEWAGFTGAVFPVMLLRPVPMNYGRRL